MLCGVWFGLGFFSSFFFLFFYFLSKNKHEGRPVVWPGHRADGHRDHHPGGLCGEF
jgi:hypothetical protein